MTSLPEAEDELIALSHAWDRAMIRNDPDGAYMADDWIIIGSDGTIGDRTRFLDLVRSGDLTHEVMESYDMNVRLYGDTAVVAG